MKRWVAFKLEIKNIIDSECSENNSIIINEKKIKRVKIMASVVSKIIGDDENYGFLVVDDGTETMRVRCFEDNLNLIKDIKLGDIIDVIGRLREYEGEIYVIPETVLKIQNPNHLVLRKLELLKQKSKMKKDEGNEENELKVTEEKIEDSNENFRDEMIKLIKTMDNDEGVEISKIKEKLNKDSEVDEMIKDLLNESEIFEPIPGKIKLLE